MRLFPKGEPKNYSPCSHRSEASNTRCQDCKVAVSARRKYRWTLIFCLVWPYALQALDSTIIASALPWIALDFGKLSQQNWIVSSFNLTSGAFIPFWAQIADVFGRNIALSSATMLMLIGSALCTGAPTNAYGVLLLGRAFQGISASGLSVLTRTILADKVSLQESAKSWSIFAAVGGFSYGLGPVVGGFLTNVNWRWCFGINLPIGVFAMVVIFIFLRKHLLGPQPIPELDETAETGRRTTFIARLTTIDFGGQALFIVGFGLIILALTWGGAAYPWKSGSVLAPLVLGVVIMVAFAEWERQFEPGKLLHRKLPRQKPMIPWALLSTRDMGLVFYEGFATGMSMFSGHDPDRAGLQLLFFVPGIGAIATLSWALYRGHSPTIFGIMAMAGAGMGLKFMVSPLHGIGLFREHRASVIALLGISMPFGGTIGLTIMSAVFNNTSGLLVKEFDFSKLRGDSAEMIAARDSVKMGVVWAYVAIVPFLVFSLIGSCFLGNVILGKENGPDGVAENIVIREPYLWYLVRGGKSTSQNGDEAGGADDKQKTEVMNNEEAV
ncbi:hypothetical protein K4F52_005089 [Lecanicillium sp. MT-2017a]|nr:hypothetical protein K4F52_005089 [Lecanicillium sp. MT-2017a]